jgi:hypothetical protein
MGHPGRVALMGLVVLLSATGTSAKDSASAAVRVLSTEGRSHTSALPGEARVTRDNIREQTILAWIILLMKDGRTAR